MGQEGLMLEAKFGDGPLNFHDVILCILAWVSLFLILK